MGKIVEQYNFNKVFSCRPATLRFSINSTVNVTNFHDFLQIIRTLINKMQKMCNLIGRNSMYISDICNCFSANIDGM